MLVMCMYSKMKSRSTRGSSRRELHIDKKSRSILFHSSLLHVGGCICKAYYQSDLISLSFSRVCSCMRNSHSEPAVLKSDLIVSCNAMIIQPRWFFPVPRRIAYQYTAMQIGEFAVVRDALFAACLQGCPCPLPYPAFSNSRHRELS